MKKTLSLIIGIITTFGLLVPSYKIFADDFEPADEEGNSSNTFILDANDTGGNITLQFGTTLAEYLQWNSSNLRFDLSNSLSLNQNEIKDVVIDNLSSAPGSPVAGQIYYNTTNSNTYIWNGSSWEDITETNSAGSAEYFDAYDSTGGTDISSGWTDIPLGTERKKTTDFTHNTGSVEVTVNTTATYVVSYTVTTNITSGTSRSESEMRLMLDQGSGYNQISGSIGRMYNRNNSQGGNTATRTLILDLSTGDKIKMQASRISGTSTVVTLADGSALTISRVEGVGPQGPAGSNTITIQDEGSNVANTPHSTLNFVGSNVTVTDAGSGVATITISGGGSSDEFEDIYGNDADNTLTTNNGIFTIDTGTDDFIVNSNDWIVDGNGNIVTSGGITTSGDIVVSGTVDGVDISTIGLQTHYQNTDIGTTSNTFTLDTNNTGGNVLLQFGNSLGENLTWDNANTEFDLSDNLDINESGEVIELGNGTATDSYINFDDGADRNFGWDDSLNALSTFDSQMSYRTIQSATPPITCSATVSGMQWMDTDTGIVYSCDTSNSRNKWLSITELTLFGDESGICSAGGTPNSNTNCNVDWGNGLGPDGSTDLGLYIPHPITVTGYGFSEDNDACTSGSFDLELWSTGSNADDNNYSLESTLASGLTGQAHNSNSLNADIAGDQYTLWGIGNNCGQGIDDWNMIVYFRYRHD